MMDLPSVSEMWNIFAKQVMPDGASATQMIEMRRAFYAGAFAIHTAQTVGVGDDSVSEEQGMAYLSAVDAELRAFFDAIQKGEV
jgi:hypothetical protein